MLKHDNVDKTQDIKRILERLAGKDSSCEISENENSVYFNEYNLKIELLDYQTANNGNNYAAYLYFKFDRTDLEEPIIEPSTALATSKEEAIDRAVDQFSTVMLSFVTPFKCEDMNSIENSFDGNKHIYKYACSLPISCMGNVKERNRSPFEIVKKELPFYLGARKYNWVKLYVGRNKSDITCEARINGILIPELTDILTEHAKEDENKMSILMEKQCIMFIQDDETYHPLRYSPIKVKEFAAEAIPYIAEIHDNESFDKSYNKIFDITKDRWLTVEIMSFIPEIVAQFRFSMIKHTSDIKLLFGDESLSIKKQQLTSWCACENAVIEMLSKGNVEDEYLMKIMNHSSSYFNVMCKIVSENPKEKIAEGNFVFSSLICNMYPDHRNYIF